MTHLFSGQPLFSQGRDDFSEETYELFIQGMLRLPPKVAIRAQREIKIARFAELLKTTEGIWNVIDFRSTFYTVTANEDLTYYTCGYGNDVLTWQQGFQSDKLILWHLIAQPGGLLNENDLYRDLRESKPARLWTDYGDNPATIVLNATTKKEQYSDETLLYTGIIDKFSKLEVRNPANDIVPTINAESGDIVYEPSAKKSADLAYNIVEAYGYNAQYKISGSNITKADIFQP